MKRFFQILGSRRLWLNAGLIGLLLVLIVFGTLFWLRAFTQHGESVGVPDLGGYPLHKLDDVVATASLNYEVTDSIYSDDFPRGVVLQQNPLPGRRVKEGRTVFLTVNSVLPEMVAMPELTGRSRRNAIPLVEIAGLQVEALSYKPDESCTDCVVDQLYKGKQITAGTQIRKGEKITLVLGRQSNERTAIPRLLGLTYEDAYGLLNAYSLNMGQILACQGCETAKDTSNAFVVNQLPVPHEAASLGSFVDLYLTTDSASAASFTHPTDTVPRYDDEPF